MKSTVAIGCSEEALLGAGELADELGEEEHELFWMMTLPDRRSQCPKTSGLLAMPLISPSSWYSHFSSRRSCSFRFASLSDELGRAKIHFCKTVQMFGVGLVGVKPSDCSIDSLFSLATL